MRGFAGVPAYPGFAIGPAYIVETWNDLVAISMERMPVIVVAPYLEERMIEVVDLRHVYGFVFDRGSVIDPMHETLAAVPKPSLIGCRGICEAVRIGQTIGVDAIQGVAVIDPEGQIRDYIEKGRGATIKREPPDVAAAYLRLAETVRTAWQHRGYRQPFDLPDEGGRLLEIARRVASGEAPTPEQDAYVKRLLEPPPAPPQPDDLRDNPWRRMPGGGSWTP